MESEKDSEKASCFYKTSEDQNCVDALTTFFADGKPGEKVCVRFGSEGSVTETHLMNFHAYLDRASCWTSVSSWKTIVTYVVQSGEGHLYVRDTDRGNLSEMFTHVEGDALGGVSRPNNVFFTVHRYSEVPFAMSTNVRNYKWAIIESKRKFVYESASSSWAFDCSVMWEGATKALAEAADRKFCITVESHNPSKFFGNVPYGCASLCEKIIDVVGRGSSWLEFQV